MALTYSGPAKGQNSVEAQPKKQLPIDLSELELALDNQDPEIHYYLDLESGAIRMVTDDILLELEDLLEDADVDQEDSAAVLQVVRDQEDPALLEAYQVRAAEGSRYLEIRQADRRAGYRAMENFIETLENRALRNHLANAIRVKGAFRNFKSILSRFPREQQQWLAFKNAHMRQGALRWLDQNGIEPLTESE